MENKESLNEKLNKLIRLSHIRGEKQTLNIPIEIELDRDIATLKEEISEALWRIEDLINS